MIGLKTVFNYIKFANELINKRNYILFTPKIRFSFEFSKSLYSNSFSKFIVISIAITV